MKPVQLDAGFSASPQLSPGDVAEASRLGFRSIIVNRPDGEAVGQPPIAAMEQAAIAAGLGFAAVPIAPGQASEADVARFAQALAVLPGPVLGYCRTGTRAATLWALAQAGRAESEALIAAGAAAGYDLSGLRPALERRLGTSTSEKQAG
jgi:sulfide:quinone oxidoreductase